MSCQLFSSFVDFCTFQMRFTIHKQNNNIVLWYAMHVLMNCIVSRFQSCISLFQLWSNKTGRSESEVKRVGYGCYLEKHTLCSWENPILSKSKAMSFWRTHIPIPRRAHLLHFAHGMMGNGDSTVIGADYTHSHARNTPSKDNIQYNIERHGVK